MRALLCFSLQRELIICKVSRPAYKKKELLSKRSHPNVEQLYILTNNLLVLQSAYCTDLSYKLALVIVLKIM